MILIAAATRWEAGPLAAALGLEGSGPTWRGTLNNHDILLFHTGIGPERIETTLRALGPLPPGSLVVSAGFCGALQPGMAASDIVLDLREAPVEWLEAARNSARETNARFHMGVVLSSDIVVGPKDKLLLGQTRRASAVDMESETWRAFARARGAQFAALRVVLDELHESAPPGDYEDGAAASLRYAMRHAAILPALIRMGWRQRRAMSSLSAFIRSFLIAITGDAIERGTEVVS